MEFTNEMKEHIRKMRHQFFETGSDKGITGVRPEILAGWKKVRAKGAKISDRFESTIGEKELHERIERQRDLYDVAVRYMEKLYEFLKGEGIYVSFVDADGYLLKNMGDDELIGTAGMRSREGSYRGPDIPMFSLYQETLASGRLFSIYATEHSNEVNDDWAGTAAPVLSKEDGRVLGVIGISCHWDKLDQHVSALVVMMAEAIADQMAIRKQQTLLEQMYEAADYGIARVGNNGRIRYMNTLGKRMLGIREEKDAVSGSYHSASYWGKEERETILFHLKYAVTMKKIQEETEKKESFECEIIPAGTSKTVVCLFRRIKVGAVDSGEYLVEIRDKAQMKKTAMKMIGSNTPFSLDDIIGESEAMQQAKSIVSVASNYMPHTLLLGESGTGKELFAQAIHNNSARAGNPFVAVNCGAIPKSLIESELFGYEAGAFTGARKQGYMGKFEQANGGTIFLDEIGDMPFETQVVLLRVLQSKEIIRVGGKKPIKIDVAVIAATNQNLQRKINEKTFRADLYYRLNTFVINIPALRERGAEDIILLAEYFLSHNPIAVEKGICNITDEAKAILAGYTWPGNVRELENVMERAVLVCEETEIAPKHIMLENALDDIRPDESFGDVEDDVHNAESFGKENEGAEAIDKYVIFSKQRTNYQGAIGDARIQKRRRQRLTSAQEEKQIREAMQECGYNLTMASEILNISRPTLYKKLEKYGIKRFGENSDPAEI